MKVIGIVATKNRVNLLVKAVNSVKNQLTPVNDLIVVSDSTEENFELEQQYLKEIDCILLKDKYTHNYAGNLNTAINYVVLKYINELDDLYIAFLDDDDTWDNEYIRKSYEFLDGSYDFVVSGLSCVNDGYHFNLDIKEEYDINDFLIGNPGIQGSNTLIKLSTLLKAGCFDENLSSTTDRDLFTRVMMLKPKYKIIREYLVNVDASNSRPRITNTSNIKVEGLSKFYYKYSNFMDFDTEFEFFKRAKNKFNASKNMIYDLINYKSFKLEKYKYHNIDRLHTKFINRKAIVDILYGKNKENKESKRVLLDYKRIGFNIFNSGLLMETPIFNSNYDFYTFICYSALNDLDSDFKEKYMKYLFPITGKKNFQKWLRELIGNISKDEFAIDIVYRAIIETIKNVNEPITYNSYFDLYNCYVDEIFTKLVINEYRIAGLKSIYKINYNYNKFICYLTGIYDEIKCEYKIRGIFDYLKHNFNKGKVYTTFNDNKKSICSSLNINVNEIETLGYGAEGFVFTNKKKIYKWFINKSLNGNKELLDNLKNVKELTKNCSLFYDYEIIDKDGMIVISYNYQPARKLMSGDRNKLLEYILELKKYNISLDNVKLDNFVVDSEGVKFIDIGTAIQPFDLFLTNKGLDRIDIIFKLSDKNELNYYFYYNKYYIDLKNRG